MAIVYPHQCPFCGEAVKSRIHATHHQRLCKKHLAEKVAVMLAIPQPFHMVVSTPDGSLTVARTVGGSGYTLCQVRGGRKSVVNEMDNAVGAANMFLELWREREGNRGSK